LRVWWEFGDMSSPPLFVPEGVRLPSVPDVLAAFEVLHDFRAAHGYPPQKARMGLQSMCRTAGVSAEVSQRLKRHRTIIDKLVRYPKMRLESMQDVAGCRAVMPQVRDVRAVQRRWAQRPGRVVRPPYDYIAHPKDSGYRGVHLIVQYDGFVVEVQLRTRLQHEWAITVERVGSRIAADLKSGAGPEPVLAFFELVSEAMALEEGGLEVPATLTDSIARARAEALPLMSRSAE
jgi:putative GTP pyrophosphokinase